MKLDGREFAVLVENHYEDLELWYPVLRLREAGAKVSIVGPQAGKTYQSKHGYAAKSDQAAGDVAVDELDGVIIPGGYAPDHMRRHEAMVSLVREAHKAGKIVAAICHAGWMLCSAGVLEGKEVTSVPAIKVDLENAGANWVDREVVQDDNLITSRTPDDLPAFMRAIIAACERSPEAAGAGERAHYAG